MIELLLATDCPVQVLKSGNRVNAYALRNTMPAEHIQKSLTLSKKTTGCFNEDQYD